MSYPRLIQFVAVGVVFAGTYFAFRPADAVQAEQQPSVLPEAEPQASPTELTGTPIERPGPTPAPAEDRSGKFGLPDGTRLPVLNGAYGAPDMSWPRDRPWSPIIGKELDDKGNEWYVHRDGSKTITQNLWHSHLGRQAPVTNVFNPTKPLPMAPDEVEAYLKDKAAKEKEQAAKAKAGTGNKNVPH